MTGDSSQGGESGTGAGTPDASGVAVSLGAGVLGGLIGGHGGRGIMAARGVSQLGQRLQILAERRAQTQANLDRAVVFSHVPRGTPTATVQTNVNPTLVKLGQAAAQLTMQVLEANRSKRQQKRTRHDLGVVQKQMARAIARGAVPTYQQIALTGLNSGPPIAGATYY